MVALLQVIEGEMDDQMSRYDELTEVGQGLIAYLQSFPQTAEKIQQTLNEYKRRWDKIVALMEEQSKKVRSLSSFLGVVSPCVGSVDGLSC